jgi:methionyl-tRNA formyltransferase
MAGDRETGVTIHRTVTELDAGPIAATAAFRIDDEDDAGSVFARAAESAAALLDGVLAQDEPQFTAQSDEGVTYAEKITPADRELDLADPERAVRAVRALSPHIGARATLDDRAVIVWRARVEDGKFRPVEVQPAGKRRMTYEEFRRGLR